MKIENSKNNLNDIKKPHFKGPLDGIITQGLITIDTNPMVNAALVDIFSMVIPRTYVDTKERNKYAGAETLFRELTGTFIVCLSSGIWALGLSHLYNKFKQPDVKVNPNSWVSNDSLNLLHLAWKKSGNNSKNYIKNILSDVSGLDGKNNVSLANVAWSDINWYDDKKWNKLTWHDGKFINIQEKLKSKSAIEDILSEIIEKPLHKKDANQILKIIEHRLSNALKVGGTINVELDDKKLSTSLHNLLRDTYDMGKNVFVNKSVDAQIAVEKLIKMNKIKTLGALAIASGLGLTNQWMNRMITKKRTGTDQFVGDLNYQNFVGKKNEKTNENKNRLLGLKLLASAGMIVLAAKVMKIKTPKDFIKKLEFTSPITSGNAIKTVYTATLVGRFLASKNETELRETATRDYLGFLNWLVFGGFAAKGVANLLDKKKENLFNISKDGKGLKNWLNNLSLKSHAEIASKGTAFAKKNIWKLNLAHISGLAYSTVALGLLLPMLNITLTKYKHKKQSEASV